MEQSRRLFFLWPPTTHNLSTLESWGSHGERLLNCCCQFEGGLIQVLDSNDALRMRPGVIHAVITLAGGFIVTKAYIDEQTLSPMSSWLVGSPSIIRQMSDGRLRIMAYNWIEAAEIATVESVIACWEAVDHLLANVLRSQQTLRKRAIRLFQEASTTSPQQRRQVEAIVRLLER